MEKIQNRAIKPSTICFVPLLCVFALVAIAAEQNVVVLLWPNGAPGSEGKTAPKKVRITPDGEHVISSVHQPSITVYLPSKETATGAAVVIAPGGSHVELWVDHEGYAVAQWLSEHGVAGFVLKYRLAREPGSTYTVEGNSLPDMQRAIRLVRSRAAEWGVDPARVGVMGFLRRRCCRASRDAIRCWQLRRRGSRRSPKLEARISGAHLPWTAAGSASFKRRTAGVPAVRRR